MRKRIASWIGIFILALAFSATPVSSARERHPEIRRAITALENAKTYLRHANHDFGGHSVDAIKACDAAIEQLRLAIRYDKD